MDLSQITEHPDYDEIVAKVVTGIGAKDISQWLKIKYSDKEQKHLCLSIKSIQEFINKHVDLQATLQRDLLAVKNNDSLTDKKIALSLANNKSYQDRLVELAGTEIDVKKLIKELVYTCNARMEQVFDKIQENPTNTKADYVLLKYFEVLFTAVERLDKIVNNAPDQIIQHNITIQAVEQHTAVIQEAVRETLAQMDPESSMFFIETLARKLSKLKEPEQESVEDRMTEAKLIRDMVVSAAPKE